MKNNREAVIKVIIFVFVFTLSALSVFFFSDGVITVTAKIALKSAQTFLPQSGVTLRSQTPETTTTEKTTEDTTKAEAVTTTLPPTTAVTTTVGVTQALSQDNFTDTPEDISALIKKAKKSADKDKKDGDISEYTYKNDGVTDKFGLVRVKNVNKTDINVEKLLKTELDLNVSKDEPSVLIFHTHTTETYQILDRDFYARGFLSRSNDKNVNMARVGKAITEEIEKSGYKVIHDTVIHDGTYNTAYAHSRKSVESYLKEYPSIKIVLDIHRDAIQRSNGTKIKPVATIEGKKAAQIMIISGCQEKDNGVENFPDWKENLVFAVHLQNTLEELFEGITRPLYFSPRKYNMDLTHCSLLVEVGSDANTLEEAVYTGKCLGKAVSEILKEYEE